MVGWKEGRGHNDGEEEAMECTLAGLRKDKINIV